MRGAGDYTGRLALQEEIRALPWGAVWERYCAAANVPAGGNGSTRCAAYESSVLSVRA